MTLEDILFEGISLVVLFDGVHKRKAAIEFGKPFLKTSKGEP